MYKHVFLPNTILLSAVSAFLLHIKRNHLLSISFHKYYIQDLCLKRGRMLLIKSLTYISFFITAESRFNCIYKNHLRIQYNLYVLARDKYVSLKDQINTFCNIRNAWIQEGGFSVQVHVLHSLFIVPLFNDQCYSTTEPP